MDLICVALVSHEILKYTAYIFSAVFIACTSMLSVQNISSPLALLNNVNAHNSLPLDLLIPRMRSFEIVIDKELLHI